MCQDGSLPTNMVEKRKKKELYGVKPPGIKFGGLGSSPQLVGSKGGVASGQARKSNNIFGG